MIFLASPYTHPEGYVRHERYEKAMKCVAALTRQGYVVYSPIVHCHPMALAYDLPKDASYWFMHSCRFIKAADEVWVLEIEGWKESAGIQIELDVAREHKKPIKYVNEEGEIVDD